jgi:hypothetical protein
MISKLNIFKPPQYKDEGRGKRQNIAGITPALRDLRVLRGEMSVSPLVAVLPR